MMGMGKPLTWLAGEVRTPPMSLEARREMGYLLRLLQEGGKPSLPHARPMPVIGKACHELRVRDEDINWRLFYHLDSGNIVILDVIGKKTQATPKAVIDTCKARLKRYEEDKRKREK